MTREKEQQGRWGRTHRRCVSRQRSRGLRCVPGLQHARKRNERVGETELGRAESPRQRERGVARERRGEGNGKERGGRLEAGGRRGIACIRGRGMQRLCPSTSLKPDPGLRIPSRLLEQPHFGILDTLDTLQRSAAVYRPVLVRLLFRQVRRKRLEDPPIVLAIKAVVLTLFLSPSAARPGRRADRLAAERNR